MDSRRNEVSARTFPRLLLISTGVVLGLAARWIFGAPDANEPKLRQFRQPDPPAPSSQVLTGDDRSRAIENQPDLPEDWFLDLPLKRPKSGDGK